MAISAATTTNGSDHTRYSKVVSLSSRASGVDGEFQTAATSSRQQPSRVRNLRDAAAWQVTRLRGSP
ncbi:hypothetical protein, partial [Stenotrophomonas sp. AS012628]|uniref:hypothetical protein n=1 Tax=Stenotrophomonas sp. AS012628 TaxID=2597656 RepID=UPI001CA99E03